MLLVTVCYARGSKKRDMTLLLKDSRSLIVVVLNLRFHEKDWQTLQAQIGWTLQYAESGLDLHSL